MRRDPVEGRIWELGSVEERESVGGGVLAETKPGILGVEMEERESEDEIERGVVEGRR